MNRTTTIAIASLALLPLLVVGAISGYAQMTRSLTPTDIRPVNDESSAGFEQGFDYDDTDVTAGDDFEQDAGTYSEPVEDGALSDQPVDSDGAYLQGAEVESPDWDSAASDLAEGTYEEWADSEIYSAGPGTRGGTTNRYDVPSDEGADPLDDGPEDPWANETPAGPTTGASTPAAPQPSPPASTASSPRLRATTFQTSCGAMNIALPDAQGWRNATWFSGTGQELNLFDLGWNPSPSVGVLVGSKPIWLAVRCGTADAVERAEAFAITQCGVLRVTDATTPGVRRVAWHADRVSGSTLDVGSGPTSATGADVRSNGGQFALTVQCGATASLALR